MEPKSYPLEPVRPAWLNQVEEGALDPALPIIDSHHHLWEHEGDRYLLQELSSDLAGGHNVVSTVYLQCGWQLRQDGPAAYRAVGETQAVRLVGALCETGSYAPMGTCAGIVGFADLRLDELDDVLDAHQAAGGLRFRGVRHSAALDPAVVPMTSSIPPPGLLLDAEFQRGLRRLGARGLTYDAWQYHPQLSDLLQAARAAPGTSIVVNHVGGPLRAPYRDQPEEVRRAWLSGMTALAGCRNVFVKLGGLGMAINGFDYHQDERPPTSEQLAADWRPWIEPCIELFGAERCMFESNFPVDKAMVGYTVLWNAFKRIAGSATNAEKSALFQGTAARFYGL